MRFARSSSSIELPQGERQEYIAYSQNWNYAASGLPIFLARCARSGQRRGEDFYVLLFSSTRWLRIYHRIRILLAIIAQEANPRRKVFLADRSSRRHFPDSCSISCGRSGSSSISTSASAKFLTRFLSVAKGLGQESMHVKVMSE